jgi:hypothetical protein
MEASFPRNSDPAHPELGRDLEPQALRRGKMSEKFSSKKSQGIFPK